MSIQVAIDIGGTFTDVVVQTDDGLTSTKTPTTPRNLVRGVEDGLDSLLTGAEQEEVSRFVHGTTAGTNAIIEQTGGRVGLLLTDGFRDTLEIGRQKRQDMYDLFIDPQTPTFLAPRERRFEISERIGDDGQVRRPLDEDEVVDAVDTLVTDFDVDAIGICYLFSFLNPDHERRTEELINERHPDVYVSRSSKVNPRFREYERLVVTAFDAYLRPVVESYVRELTQTLDDRGMDCHLQIMQSRGGITGADLVVEKPVTTVLSGPAAAVAGASAVAAEAGYEDLITMDMGGTSCDVSLIEDGSPRIASEGKILNYPLRIPMVDISTVGSGGGSIAHLDRGGNLRVGPDSAGSDPGPVCYDEGGSAPTVTDASLLLGYLNPTYFADGLFDLDVAAATEAVRSSLAEPLDYTVTEVAKGVHDVVNTKMAEELRLNTVNRGLDPRSFSLFAMGGAGPVHAGRVAENLRIPRVVVPRMPGVLSARGLLAADIEHDVEKTFAASIRNTTASDVEAALSELIEEGHALMEREGVAPDEVRTTRRADMRYEGQSFELEIELPASISSGDLADIRDRFHEQHASVHGHMNTTNPVQFVTLRVVMKHTPEAVETPEYSGGTSLSQARKGSREMAVPNDETTYEADVYERRELPTDATIEGPAIVEQKDTTTVLYPGHVCTVDDHGNFVIETGVTRSHS